MAMGLCNAPDTFQTLMNRIFLDVIDNLVVICLDDLLVFSNTVEETVKHVALLFGRIRENQLFSSQMKCLLFKNEVEFLGLLRVGTVSRSIQQKSR